jgi:hypothetical protein
MYYKQKLAQYLARLMDGPLKRRHPMRCLHYLFDWGTTLPALLLDLRVNKTTVLCSLSNIAMCLLRC